MHANVDARKMSTHAHYYAHTHRHTQMYTHARRRTQMLTHAHFDTRKCRRMHRSTHTQSPHAHVDARKCRRKLTLEIGEGTQRCTRIACCGSPPEASATPPAFPSLCRCSSAGSRSARTGGARGRRDPRERCIETNSLLRKRR